MHHRRQVSWLVEAEVAHRSLGPADALRHRRLGHEVGLGDLSGGQPAHSTQRQRHRRGRGERRVGAQEVQPECVVDARHLARRLVAHRRAALGLVGPTRSGRRSMNACHAVVISHPFGSRGGSFCQAVSALTIASWTASSAVAKSAPRRTRTFSTSGANARSSGASTSAVPLTSSAHSVRFTR